MASILPYCTTVPKNTKATMGTPSWIFDALGSGRVPILHISHPILPSNRIPYMLMLHLIRMFVRHVQTPSSADNYTLFRCSRQFPQEISPCALSKRAPWVRRAVHSEVVWQAMEEWPRDVLD
ncbi:hypothetical protein WG66_009807 [Moniliophthora roreri]|nr:hypothetical protein WG66_009807 [Moniliophthora roreri]